MSLKNLNIRTKIIYMFLACGLIPLIASNTISYLIEKKSLIDSSYIKASTDSDRVNTYITQYLEFKGAILRDLAISQTTVRAIKSFSSTITKIATEHNNLQEYTNKLTDYYNLEFNKLYYEANKKKYPIESFMNKLDDISLVAQYNYIIANKNPISQKHLLINAARNNEYDQMHKEIHPYIIEFSQNHGLVDIFLIDDTGRIVYSMFKESDFATSLTDGPWNNTNIANAYRQSLSLNKGDIYMEDLSIYTPSYDAPSLFISTPVYDNGKKIGVAIFQLSTDEINKVTNERHGMSEKDEVLLVGSDYKLRSDTFRNRDTHNLGTSFNNKAVIVKSKAIEKAVAGESGVMRNISYDGLKTIAHYSQLKAFNLNWFIVTELDENVVLKDLKILAIKILIMLFISSSVITFVAYKFGYSVYNKLKTISETLDNTSKEVSSASMQSAASSTELSEAATEQAASLQETMASIEEISAMVSQNADSSAKAKSFAELNKTVSDEGSNNVNEMKIAIDDIKSTNDQILSQIEDSNKELNEIVKIITDIGEKTKVINEIVFQTKLLSLNASVEAARAGEYGRGFAVVAEEVGNLAQMSGSAAKEITDMLSHSVTKVDEIVKNTSSKVDKISALSKEKINLGQQTAGKCQDALSKIKENAVKLSDMFVEIANASKEQAQGVQEINKAISQLDIVTQQNSSVAQNSSSQAEKLNNEAHALVNAVNELLTFIEGQEKNSENTTESSVAIKNVKPAIAAVIKKDKPKSSIKNSKNNNTPKSEDPNFEDF